MLQEKEYEKVLRKIGDCFQSLKQRIFVDRWLQESTGLIFALVNETENPKQMFAFENWTSENYSLEVCDLNDYEDYDLAIADYLFSKGYAGKNTEKELREFILLGCKINVKCICVSPCLKNNKGKLLLEQAFRTMVESFREWCLNLDKLERKPEDGELQELPDNNWHDFVQRVLQKTYMKVNEQLEGFYSPIKIPYIISLSGEYYEKTENNSNLLFLPQIGDDEIDASCLKYDFREESSQRSGILFVPGNIRRIRKLTQIAQGPYMILQVCPDEKEYEVLGICEKESIKHLIKRQLTNFPYFICRTKGHMKWDLFLGEQQYIFSFINGDYRITSDMSEEYLEDVCLALFSQAGFDLEEIKKNIHAAKQQSHGTMLVILSEEHANSEAMRFSRRNSGMRDARPNVRVDVLKHLTSIDGSVLMDSRGKVHSIGVILDGDNEVMENPERGARYNSALKYCRYLENEKIPGLILIVSEDGSIDMMKTGFRI